VPAANAVAPGARIQPANTANIRSTSNPAATNINRPPGAAANTANVRPNNPAATGNNRTPGTAANPNAANARPNSRGETNNSARPNAANANPANQRPDAATNTARGNPANANTTNARPNNPGSTANARPNNPANANTATARSNNPATSNNPARANQGNTASLGGRNAGGVDRSAARRAVNGATAGERQTQRVRHRGDLQAARARLPRRPLPGERNFTGVPPAGETRFVSTEMVFQVGPGVSRQAIDDLAARFGLTVIGSQRSALTGGTLFHFRLAGGRGVADLVRALEAERIGVAQPNYVYRLGQNETPDARQDTGDAQQYVGDKLRLAEAHKIATGKGVLVAVIDSAIDGRHPDLDKAIVKKFEPAGGGKPHAHGTGMVGAIAAHGRLTGIAPDARVLAVHAFSATRQSPQATTRNIVAGLEWALDNKARVINMSFAGPYDPMLQVAMKKAHEKGVVLIAAMGNQGAKSPPLYPAADPHVIAVTATDENDALYDRANRGAHVAVAAPGVDIMAAAPDGTYQMTTGTSVAAAHVSGVAALLIERHPSVDAKTVLEVLTASATKLGTDARDDQFGFGLIDPAAALEELDARIADAKVAAPAATPAAARAAPAPTPAAAQAKPVLPRPGIYAPR
jgi:hypothetical protein